MNLFESPNLYCVSNCLSLYQLNELYRLYKLYEPNELPSSLVRSYLSSRHKLHKLNELYELNELNELYFQSLVRRYPSTDSRQPPASSLQSPVRSP